MDDEGSRLHQGEFRGSYGRVVYVGLRNPISEECTLQSTLPEKREAPDWPMKLSIVGETFAS